MPVSADDHCRFLDFIWVGGLNDVYHIEAAQRGKALFPRYSWAFSLDFL
jgi:hypothetical protein